MKIKNLRWYKRIADDPDKSSWWETKPPIEYCIDVDALSGKFTLWITNVSSDKKLGQFKTKELAQRFAQKHFETWVKNVIMERQ